MTRTTEKGNESRWRIWACHEYCHVCLNEHKRITYSISMKFSVGRYPVGQFYWWGTTKGLASLLLSSFFFLIFSFTLEDGRILQLTFSLKLQNDIHIFYYLFIYSQYERKTARFSSYSSKVSGKNKWTPTQNKQLSKREYKNSRKSTSL